MVRWLLFLLGVVIAVALSVAVIGVAEGRPCAGPALVGFDVGAALGFALGAAIVVVSGRGR